MKAFLNASGVARLFNVNRATVTRWIKKGIIKQATKPRGTQNWRIPLASYEDLIKKR